MKPNFQNTTRLTWSALVVVLALALIELIRTAWIADDAAITLRTVLNLVHGHGAVFNLGERVQAYTHPLWFLLISALSLITGNVFTSTFILAIGLSMIVLLVIIFGVARSIALGLCAALVLMTSKAYVDFTASGLENPLSHLLLLSTIMVAATHFDKIVAADVHTSRNRYLLIFFTLSSLLFLTRPDLLVLILPLFVLVLVSNRKYLLTTAGLMVVGFLPAILWSLGSLYYYGFMLPNTAYAKLLTGIPQSELIAQGFDYLADSISRDPLTLAVIGFAAVFGMKSARPYKALAVGLLLYLTYVVRIGGDFMTGRFLTPPLVVATAILATIVFTRRQLQIGGAVLAILAAVGMQSTLFSGKGFHNKTIAANGIADERGFYYQQYGLLTAANGTFDHPEWSIVKKKPIIICGTMGFRGIADGPGTHFVDVCGLADPLLARLPAQRLNNWRIGHFYRQIPTDYMASIQTGKNLLKDEPTRSFYETIRLITRAKLSDQKRLQAIMAMHLGRVKRPDGHMYRSEHVPLRSETVQIDYADLNTIVAPGTPSNSATVLPLKYGVDVQLSAPMQIRAMDLSLDHNDRYKIEIWHNGAFAVIGRLSPSPGPGMARYRIAMDRELPPTETVRISVTSGDSRYALGHFIINPVAD